MGLVALALIFDGIANGQPVSLVGGIGGLACVLYVAVRTRKRLQTGELSLDNDR